MQCTIFLSPITEPRREYPSCSRSPFHFSTSHPLVRDRQGQDSLITSRRPDASADTGTDSWRPAQGSPDVTLPSRRGGACFPAPIADTCTPNVTLGVRPDGAAVIGVRGGHHSGEERSAGTNDIRSGPRGQHAVTDRPARRDRRRRWRSCCRRQWSWYPVLVSTAAVLMAAGGGVTATGAGCAAAGGSARYPRLRRDRRSDPERTRGAQARCLGSRSADRL